MERPQTYKTLSKIPFAPLSKELLHSIKKGDVLERMLGFQIPVYVVVQDVKDGIIDAGWTFSQETGLEIDEDIPTTVSYIRKILTEEEKEIIKKGGKL